MPPAYTESMKAKSLAAKNRYLKKDSSGKSVIRNAATSTSIETGKPSDKYVTRYSDSETLAEVKIPGPRKK
jgi:hypothetical protein